MGLVRRRTRRREVAERRQALVDKHPAGTIYVTWENADPHGDEEAEAVVRAAAGRLVRLYVPPYSPGLNPSARRWRHCRREVTHGELLASIEALLKAAHALFDPDHQDTERLFAIIAAHAA